MRPALICLVTLALVGCGNEDAARDAAIAIDLTAADLSATPATDLPAGCLYVATWPANKVYGKLTENPESGFDADTTLLAFGPKPPQDLIAELQIDIYHRVGNDNDAGMPLPRTVTYSPSDKLGAVTDVLKVVALEGDAYVIYFAQAGTMTIKQADHSVGYGTISASGSGVSLVEWDVNSPVSQPLPNGRCYFVASFDLTAQYSSTDGGTDM